ncbi:MAG TPA: carbohydrate ABC transporter permease, partial [Terrimesophilobacter sp.]
MSVVTGLEKHAVSLPPNTGRARARFSRTTKYLLLILFVVVVLMPVYVLVVTSLKPPQDVNPATSWGLPVR